MIRLIDKPKNNDYNEIFDERAKQEPHWQDLRRWKTLLKYFKKGILVDLGCLDSGIPDLLNQKYDPKTVIYVGIDEAGKAISKMKEKYNHYFNTLFHTGDVYDVKLMANEYDYVILGEVLEHLESPEKAVKEAFRILKPSGILAISVPLNEAREPGAVDKDRHLWSFSGQDIEEMVEPYSSKVKFKVLSSKWFPKYKYCFPQLLAWCWKR